MKQKNKIITAAMSTFAFLYAGTIIYTPVYYSRSPILEYLTVSAVLLVYSVFISKLLVRPDNSRRRRKGRCFSVLSAILICFVLSSLLARYAKTLDMFSGYYGKAFVVVCAAVLAVFVSVYAAFRGRICVFGISKFAFILFLVWGITGFFAFFTMKGYIAVQHPFQNISNTGILKIVFGIAYALADVTIISSVILEKENSDCTGVLSKGIFLGTGIYVFMSGVNLIKNLMLFGAEMTSLMVQPDFCALRLVPMLDLPEAGLASSTFACIIKASVYFCFCMFVFKGAYKSKYRSKYASFALLGTTGVFFAVQALFNNTKTADIFYTASVICLLLCAVIRICPFKLAKNAK